jgi:IgA Peptidase M64
VEDMRHGSIVGAETIHGDGNPAGKFNIVILGDGFTTPDLPKFDAAAGLVRDFIIGLRPFSVFAGRMNIHKVRAQSTQSGVSGCPDGGTRHTYFEVQGDWDPMPGAPPAPSYFGMAHPEWAYEAASTFASVNQIGVIMMLVNCSARGGSAPLGLGLSFASLGALSNSAPPWGPYLEASMEEFQRLAVHESAHVLGGLCDEYISCFPWDGMTHPNMAHAGDPVPWKELANETELEGGANWIHVYEMPNVPPGNPPTCADDPEYCAHNRPCWVYRDASLPPGQFTELGLYWGCQYKDPEVNPDLWRRAVGCLEHEDWGRNFFRAQARCMMRNLDQPFCRPCTFALAKAIAQTAGITLREVVGLVRFLTGMAP